MSWGNGQRATRARTGRLRARLVTVQGMLREIVYGVDVYSAVTHGIEARRRTVRGTDRTPRMKRWSVGRPHDYFSKN